MGIKNFLTLWKNMLLERHILVNNMIFRFSAWTTIKWLTSFKVCYMFLSQSNGRISTSPSYLFILLTTSKPFKAIWLEWVEFIWIMYIFWYLGDWTLPTSSQRSCSFWSRSKHSHWKDCGWYKFTYWIEVNSTIKISWFRIQKRQYFFFSL